MGIQAERNQYFTNFQNAHQEWEFAMKENKRTLWMRIPAEKTTTNKHTNKQTSIVAMFIKTFVTHLI